KTLLRVIQHANKLEICSNIHSLAKVYIEPTSKCNLKCQTCIRKTWQESMGSMTRDIFDSLIEQLKEFEHLQCVMFGGFGEPTCHKDILYMIRQVKSLGIKAEMVTNGTLLNEQMIKGLFESGLDTLWVSFDGTNQECFEDIREGALFNEVVQNLKRLKEINQICKHKIKVGITFVVMRKNLDQLKELDVLAAKVGAEMISVSNVIPYSVHMIDEMVCDLNVANGNHLYQGTISFPFIDIRQFNKHLLYEMFQKYNNVSILRNKIDTKREIGSCRFIQERCSFIKWDGNVSPCMGLLHSYKNYFPNGIERNVTAYSLGAIRVSSLKEIWNSQEYYEFRNKVDEFDFSPCLHCGTCYLAETNKEDCFGNNFPTCGGCLWAQGIIQCP
ncbi:MAG: radical SAM protein, partial [Clostridiaceae bacterium]|nr:radical SAM protein [Clostridiaceae bacterium]